LTRVLELDPYAWEFHEDPYPTYRRLRDEAPLYRNDRLGFWALSRHEDVLAGFKDSVNLSNAEGVSLDRAADGNPADRASFLAMDPPATTRCAASSRAASTPKRVADLEPRIRAIATEHIDRFVARGQCDFIQELAGPLPMDVVSELLGVPGEDRDQLRHWAGLLHARTASSRSRRPRPTRRPHLDVLPRPRRRPPPTAGAGPDEARSSTRLDGARLSERDVASFLF
jgi:cytochrome P450